MKHIFIVGCKGIPAKYGGYETFVENLTKRQINSDIKYHVACLGDSAKEYEYNGAHCFQMNVPKIGAARAVYADIMAFKYILNYVKENNINNYVVLVLACRIGIVFKKYVKKVHKTGGKVIVNPDGHEWMRSKWSKPIKKYWKYSEKKMVKYADLLICDSVNIEKYINEEYRKYNPTTTFIAYGADISKSKIADNDTWIDDWMKKFEVKPFNYYLVVGRFVPENNYETIIKEFMKSNVKKDLVIVTNYEQNKFFHELKEKLHFEKDKRIKFVGTVYNPEYIKRIRELAFAYIHGHSVGGTNPSLLEGLASTKINLLYDCEFNREVGQKSCFYWNLSNLNLASKLEYVDSLSPLEIDKIGISAKEIVIKQYNWELIVSSYEKEYWRIL